MKILLVDDERKFGLSMEQGLGEAGFAVDWRITGEDGLQAFRRASYDIVLLDLMLPTVSGWAVLETIRRYSQIPVLILTACDSDADRRRALDLGASDYLAKPVNFSQLLARINCLMQERPATENLIRVGTLQIDRAAEHVSRDGMVIKLGAREYKLLLLLVTHANKVLPLELIAEHVWGMSLDLDRSVVDAAVRRLKEKIDQPFPTSLIHIIPGAGYALKE